MTPQPAALGSLAAPAPLPRPAALGQVVCGGARVIVMVMDSSRICLLALCLVGAVALPSSGYGRDSSARGRAGIDLLKLIDPAKDAVMGAWKFEDKKLVTTGRPFDKLEIPYVPPEEYDVVVVAERHGESNSLNLGLAQGEIQFMVILDVPTGSETVGALDLVDGRPVYNNKTTFKGRLFTEDKTSKVVCSVRKSRIMVTVDGKKVIDWEGDYKRLSLFPQWKVHHKNTLLVGTWTGVVRYHKLELIPISGRGKALR